MLISGTNKLFIGFTAKITAWNGSGAFGTDLQLQTGEVFISSDYWFITEITAFELSETLTADLLVVNRNR